MIKLREMTNRQSLSKYLINFRIMSINLCIVATVLNLKITCGLYIPAFTADDGRGGGVLIDGLFGGGGATPPSAIISSLIYRVMSLYVLRGKNIEWTADFRKQQRDNNSDCGFRYEFDIEKYEIEKYS